MPAAKQSMVPHLVILSILTLPLLLALRIYLLLPSTPPSTRSQPLLTCTLGVFFGSGGHSAEMKILLSTVDFSRYTPRIYVFCHGDELSLRAVAELESDPTSSSKFTLLALPRARRVGQSIPSTLLSTLYTLVIATYHVFWLPLFVHPLRPWVDVLIVNGPGTCVVLVVVSWIRRVLGLRYTRIIYVESFARVKSLSLSGKLVKRFVDTFVVQWPDAAEVGHSGHRGQVQYRGWLV